MIISVSLLVLLSWSQRVKAHINRYERLTTSDASNHGPVFTVGDLEVHLDSRRVLRKQKEIILANKEFDLLAFLIENPDVVFSKETLFDRIWGMEPMGETSTVTVHINRIREKLSLTQVIHGTLKQYGGSRLSFS